MNGQMNQSNMKRIKKYVNKMQSIDIVLWFAIGLYSFMLIGTIIKWS